MAQLVAAFGEAYAILQEAATDRFPKVINCARRCMISKAALTSICRCRLQGYIARTLRPGSDGSDTQDIPSTASSAYDYVDITPVLLAQHNASDHDFQHMESFDGNDCISMLHLSLVVWSW